jgi:NADPH:quinone reductase-like Zn-dependent oxidoreductase
MTAIRIHDPPPGESPHSAANPAPSTTLYIAEDIPKPHVSKPGEAVVKIKATTGIRDNLTWPELYADPPAHLGNDFSGLVTETHGDETKLKVGDEVYGMVNAGQGGTWAEYALMTAGGIPEADLSVVGGSRGAAVERAHRRPSAL